MEAILPHNTQDREHFCNCAMEIGFDEFVATKFIYTMQDSDLDIFQLKVSERISLLLYGWEACHMHLKCLPDNSEQLPANVQTVIKRLTQHSLDIWFSKEWDKCQLQFKTMLLFCLKRAKEVLRAIPELSVLNWDDVLELGLTPRNFPYLHQFEVPVGNRNISLRQSSEYVEEPATAEDMAFLKKEGLIIILLRMIKMFDAGWIEGVKRFSMRVIAAWNRVYEDINNLQNIKYTKVLEEHKQALILICHIYLMAIYEADDISGYVIDNMMNNIRFYYQSIQEKTASDDCSVEHLEYTPARYIAMTCVNLRISSKEFFESFIFGTYDECFTSLFGVISQSYMSYLLGNLTMEMNNMNEQKFRDNLENYKRIINLYVLERERSEIFILRELRKKEMQSNSHSLTAVVENMTDFKSKMCKGNRMSNIGNYEISDELDESDVKDDILEEESDRRMDPIFQNIPDYDNVLSYVYNVLAQRTYKGWHFAKIVLLLKIIGHELNVIETWRYHPGLTTDFMLNLEMKLSHHFEDLAKIFQEHPFMEQEFWLTAFYLNPCNTYYERIIRCGMRINRRRLNADGNEICVKPDPDGKPEKNASNSVNAKFGLLSSTIDVQEIVKMANHESPESDYDPLLEALRSFRLSESVIKDLLTVTFLPRNKSFAWAVNWAELRKRCKNLLKNAEHKRRLVELNMAEANDRLKFLKIDYDKYKHRPQLDYGSIEEGYEGISNYTNYDNDSDDNIDDEESEDFEADSDLDAPKKDEPKKQDHSEFFDSYFMSTRRTRARAAAVIATALHKGRHSNQDEEEESDNRNDEEDESNKRNDEEEESSSESKNQSDVTINETVTGATTSAASAPAPVVTAKHELSVWLNECTAFQNDTNGFQSFPDIWNFEEQELLQVQNSCMANLETKNLLEKFVKLKSMKQLKKTRLTNQLEKGENEEDIGTMTFKKQAENQDSDSDKSNMSTTAHRDSEDICDYQRDEHDDQHESHQTEREISDGTRSKNGTRPGPRQSKTFAPFESRKESTDSTDIILFNDNSISSMDSNEEAPSTAARLMKQCKEKQLQVKLSRLTVSDLANLRQPIVRLTRLDMNKFIEESTKRARQQHRVSSESDDTSKSSIGSPDSNLITYQPRGVRTALLKRKQYSSESSTDTDEYQTKRRLVRPPRGRAPIPGSSSSSSSSRGRPKNLTVIPRSASGLKLRISSTASRAAYRPPCSGCSSVGIVRGKALPVIDYIQISSSSSSSDSCEAETPHYLHPVAEESEIDPLYEEEIIPI